MKKYWFCEKPAILTEAEKAQRKFHPVVLMAFYLLFGVFLINYLNYLSAIAFATSSSSSEYMMKLRTHSFLFYLVPFSLFLFFVRFVEKRSWASMGIVKNNALKIYLIIMGIIIFGGLILVYILKKQDPVEDFFFAASEGISIIINRFCYAIAVYGFLLISLANRMSMKNAVIVVALLPLVYFAMEVIDALAVASDAYPMEIRVSSHIFAAALSTVTSIIFMASRALLLLRTSHIWGVAILVLAGIFVTGAGAGFGLPFPFSNIVSIVIAAAILCAVLFWPKKTLVNQEGAGVVSQ